MKAKIINSPLTGRIRRLQLTAESFEEERILKMLFDGIMNDDTLFELSHLGESCGSFRFNGGHWLDTGQPAPGGDT